MLIKQLGIKDYNQVWLDMKQFTQERNSNTQDELWFLEHYPVFTQGQAGKPEHILQDSPIPLIQSDRGGQVTYHGPGQLIAYTLLDIQRMNIGVRTFVSYLEQILIKTLAYYDILGTIKCGAPGVYVKSKKIASIGLRVKNGRVYHGVSLNVSMDLAPFNLINPCGFSTLHMTQVQDFCPAISIKDLEKKLIREFETKFSL